MWMLFVLNYGVLKGTREIVKKKSLQRSSVMEVLFSIHCLLFICMPGCEKCSADGYAFPACGGI